MANWSPQPNSVWNRIPDEIREDVVEFAFEHDDLTPRELTIKNRREELLRIGIINLPHSQGCRSGHRASAYRHPRRGPVPGHDYPVQCALADRLHPPQGDRLGPVLSQHDP